MALLYLARSSEYLSWYPSQDAGAGGHSRRCLWLCCLRTDGEGTWIQDEKPLFQQPRCLQSYSFSRPSFFSASRRFSSVVPLGEIFTLTQERGDLGKFCSE